MKTYSFSEILTEHYSPKQIREIKEAAKREVEFKRSMQQEVAKMINSFMEEENIGFNDLSQRLGASTAQLKRLQKGEANFTVATLAHLAALMKRKPVIKFVSP